MTERVKLTEADHAWVERFGLTCCQRCGIVKRRNGTNKPCPGPVRIAFRQALKDQDPQT